MHLNPRQHSFVKTAFDVEKCLSLRQGLSKRKYFLCQSAASFWKCKLFLQLAVIN